MLCLVILLLMSIMLPHWSMPEPNSITWINLPNTIGDWKLSKDKPKNTFLGTVQFTQLVYRDYARNGETISIAIGLDDRMNRYLSFLSPKTTYPDAVGISVERNVVDLGFKHLHVMSTFSLLDGGSILSYHWREHVKGTLNEIVRACLALDQSPFRRFDYGVDIRVDTEAQSTRRGRMLADARLRDFVSHLDMSEILSVVRK